MNLKMKNKSLLFAIIVLAFLLRFVGISKYPIGFTQDEAGLGYEAYSLLSTGKDSWGNSFPLTLRSFGDFKLPLYSYLAVPTVAIFGLNKFAVRLPNALLGTAAVYIIYLLVNELQKRVKNQSPTSKAGQASLITNHQSLASIAALLLAISPWHISLSRGAFEANLTTFFMPFGIWAFLKGLKTPSWMILSSILFGLNFYSYHSARVLTPIIVILLILYLKISGNNNLINKSAIWKSIKRYKIAVVILAVFFLSSLGSLFQGAASRGLDVALINPTDKWEYMSQRRFEAIKQGIPAEVARIFSNKVTYIADNFVSNYLSYISPIFLFSRGASDDGYGMIPGRGVLYLVEILFLTFFLIQLIKEQKPYLIFIFLWIKLPPSLEQKRKATGFPVTRAAVMVPAIQIASACGFNFFLLFLEKSFKNKNFIITIKTLFFGILFASLIFFLEDYLFHAPVHASESMQYGRGELINYVSGIEDKYDKIFMSRTLSVPHIWVAFYKKWDPKDHQKESIEWLKYEEEGWQYLDQISQYSLGKYTFGSIDLGSLKKENALIVGTPEEFPESALVLSKFYYLNGEEAFYVVESKSL